MNVLIVGRMSRDLGQAGKLAMARGAKLLHAEEVAAALAVVRSNAAVDLILCDLAADIAALLRSLRNERIDVPVVACGPTAAGDSAVAAIGLGAREFLELPPSPDLIAALLEAVAEPRHALIVGDPAMRATVARAEQVAPSDASVLLTGESGTGKEVLARHIHRRSRRAQGPFIALNCSAIPDALLESELFGHEKGAFSGAIARRIGKFEAADGGTLLLDEIGEMDIRLQAKLLRALQEREIDRIGGAAPVRVNVRILATTNRALLDEVQRQRFREDLYFRLNVISIHIPPLRERRGDVIPLARHFVRRFAELNGLPARELSPAAQRRLLEHGWRGNVRELENVMHRAVLLATSELIEADVIETMPVAGGQGTRAPEAGAQADAAMVGQRMEDVERALILQTLRHTAGNRTHAATILGISIRALRNKLRSYAAAGVAVPPPAAGVAA